MLVCACACGVYISRIAYCLFVAWQGVGGKRGERPCVAWLYIDSISGAILYSQVARAVSMLSGTFSSVTTASGIGTCWAEVNPEGQPPSPPRVVKRCARLESESVQVRSAVSLALHEADSSSSANA